MYQKKIMVNQLKTEFCACSENEGLARSLICAFISKCDPSVSEFADVRCAVSEAVTNAIVHAYAGLDDIQRMKKTVYVHCTLYRDRSVRIVIRDKGCGIADVEQAMVPLYTTDTTGERSGMGFSIMKGFMDVLRVESRVGVGTTVTMKKKFS